MVTEQSGKTVPAATVSLTQTTTGLKRLATVDASGNYIFTFVEPGMYVIEAQASGFKTFLQPALRLEVGQTIELPISLVPGDIEETMNVNATEFLQLDAAGASLGGVIGRARVEKSAVERP
jgi:hypothetical protein